MRSLICRQVHFINANINWLLRSHLFSLKINNICYRFDNIKLLQCIACMLYRWNAFASWMQAHAKIKKRKKWTVCLEKLINQLETKEKLILLKIRPIWNKSTKHVTIKRKFKWISKLFICFIFSFALQWKGSEFELRR